MSTVKAHGVRARASKLLFQAFPNICGSNPKLFQGMSWRVCVISMGYDESNAQIQIMVPKIFSSVMGSGQSSSVEQPLEVVTQILFFRNKNFGHRLFPREVGRGVYPIVLNEGPH
jgi:hypothetical protein